MIAGMAPTIDEVLAPGFLRMVFQPIVKVSLGEVQLYGVEALVRGPGDSVFSTASHICDYVRRRRAECSFDRACARLALEQARPFAEGLSIHVNVHAATLNNDPEFVALLRELAEERGFGLDRLVLEIVEHAEAWADYRLEDTLDRARALGIRIALDDVGAGHSNFRMILDLRPDHFKVDRYFVHGCSMDGGRRGILSSIVELAHRLGAGVTAEGVEAREDLRTATLLGFDSFQGFLFGRAAPAGEIDRGGV